MFITRHHRKDSFFGPVKAVGQVFVGEPLIFWEHILPISRHRTFLPFSVVIPEVLMKFEV